MRVTVRCDWNCCCHCMIRKFSRFSSVCVRLCVSSVYPSTAWCGCFVCLVGWFGRKIHARRWDVCAGVCVCVCVSQVHASDSCGQWAACLDATIREQKIDEELIDTCKGREGEG